MINIIFRRILNTVSLTNSLIIYYNYLCVHSLLYISELNAGAIKSKHELEGESSLGTKRPKSNGN